MSDDTFEELPRDPVWAQAALDAVKEFKYGDVIPQTWIDTHLEIPKVVGKITAAQHQDLSFERMEKTIGFRDMMLYEHNRLLVTLRCQGYRVMPPSEQTKAAMDRFGSDFRKSANRAMDALTHIEDTMLSVTEIRENADAKARLAWLTARTLEKLKHKKD